MTLTSVVIVSHKPGDWLSGSVASAVAQADEVVVVDNGSAGEEASSIARRAGARAVRCARNLGFSGGVAAGLDAVSGDLVGLLNDDAVAGPTWLSSAADALATRALAAVTPKVVLRGQWREIVLDDDEWFAPGDQRPLGRQLRSVVADGAEVLGRLVGAGVHGYEEGDGGAWRWTAGRRPFYVPVAGADSEVLVNGEPGPSGPGVRLLNHAGLYLLGHGIGADIGLGAPDDGRFDQPADVFGFSGTAPVFTADALARVGRFAIPFFAYNEDTDWCVRAHLLGLHIGYGPGGVVTHRLSATSGGGTSPLVQMLAQRNALLCLVRTAPLATARSQVAIRLRRGRHDPVVRSLLRRLPWAIGSRLAMRRHWVASPADVWSYWAERGSEWDTSPSGLGGVMGDPTGGAAGT